MNNIYDQGFFKVFLSHDSNKETKKYTDDLKEELHFFGISCFVAHNNIYPGQEWEKKINLALCQMDGFIALLTNTFHGNIWTDQELGFAVCKKVPIIPVAFENINPKGFIAKLQSVVYDSKEVSTKIAQTFIKDCKMIDPYLSAVKECQSYNVANKLSQLLSSIEILSEYQKEGLFFAFNNNIEINQSYGFKGEYGWNNGKSLAYELNRLSSESQFAYQMYKEISPKLSRLVKVQKNQNIVQQNLAPPTTYNNNYY